MSRSPPLYRKERLRLGWGECPHALSLSQLLSGALSQFLAELGDTTPWLIQMSTAENVLMDRDGDRVGLGRHAVYLRPGD